MRCDARRYFNVRLKADTSQLNLPHGTKKLNSEKQGKKLKSKKTDMLRSIGVGIPQSTDSMIKENPQFAYIRDL